MFSTMAFYDDLKQVLAWPQCGAKDRPAPRSIAATLESLHHEIAELKRENAQLKVRERRLGLRVARLDATEPALLEQAMNISERQKKPCRSLWSMRGCGGGVRAGAPASRAVAAG